MSFKVGDWVTNKDNELFQLEEIHVWQDLSSIVSHWKPKECEWCWFWRNGYKEPKLIKFKQWLLNSTIDDGGTVEPFIGELPSFVKDN